MDRIIQSPASKFRPFRRQLIGSSSDSATGAAAATDEHPNYILLRYQILDPDSDIVAQWNRVFLVTCLIALFIDPLYFYTSSVGGPACLTSEVNLGVVITFFRTVTDLFFLLHMVLKFRTAYVAPSSRVFGRGELVMDAKAIATRYLKSDFVIDLAATLPLPQVCSLSLSLLDSSPSHFFSDDHRTTSPEHLLISSADASPHTNRFLVVM